MPPAGIFLEQRKGAARIGADVEQAALERFWSNRKQKCAAGFRPLGLFLIDLTEVGPNTG